MNLRKIKMPTEGVPEKPEEELFFEPYRNREKLSNLLDTQIFSFTFIGNSNESGAFLPK